MSDNKPKAPPPSSPPPARRDSGTAATTADISKFRDVNQVLRTNVAPPAPVKPPTPRKG